MMARKYGPYLGEVELDECEGACVRQSMCARVHGKMQDQRAEEKWTKPLYFSEIKKL